MVVIKPRSISKLSFITLATGAKQFVVHDALEIIMCWLDNMFSLPPYTTVASTFSPGAEMITFFAPECMWSKDFSFVAKYPELSITTSMFSFFQGSFSGFFLGLHALEAVIIQDLSKPGGFPNPLQKN